VPGRGISNRTKIASCALRNLTVVRLETGILGYWQIILLWYN
jgi:hypothetical protein